MRVKICGITSVNDAQHAVAAGADALGLVFYPPSPRYVESLELAADIARAAGPFVTVVGLFVDPAPEYLNRVLAAVPLDILQFHGNESPEFCSASGRPYLKALRMKPSVDIAALANSYTDARGILLDAYRKGVPGGTGETFDWAAIPHNINAPLVLAGGLTPSNIAKACAQVGPYGVDVSGGVEATHGIKDPALVSDFITQAKQAR
ncbi:MAG: phosphoribosylanthranilate isomerase [Marinagarivorans sp.]|nr:phosphoribosylanthranilate isomerase [Marinagarivorans sp.]